jgi:hypothetical protein
MIDGLKSSASKVTTHASGIRDNHRMTGPEWRTAKRYQPRERRMARTAGTGASQCTLDSKQRSSDAHGNG